MRSIALIAIALTLAFSASVLTANAIETQNVAIKADSASNAKGAIVTGETYPFAEQDLLTQIQKHIETNKEAIEAILKSRQSRAREQINLYKPKDLTTPLPRANKDRTFEPDLSYVVPEDIKDARGVVIYPKGYRYNPLDYVWLKTSYIVIDATDRLQVEWLKHSGFLNKLQYQIWLSNGSWTETSKELNQSVYYVNQAITDRFKLKAVPSLIRQTTDPKTSYSVIKVQEICIDCNKTNDKANEQSELGKLDKRINEPNDQSKLDNINQNDKANEQSALDNPNASNNINQNDKANEQSELGKLDKRINEPNDQSKLDNINQNDKANQIANNRQTNPNDKANQIADTKEIKQ